MIDMIWCNNCQVKLGTGTCFDCQLMPNPDTQPGRPEDVDDGGDGYDPVVSIAARNSRIFRISVADIATLGHLILE